METMDDYKDELEASFRRINEGDIISGTVIDVNEEEVTLDLKYYAQGIIKVADLSNDPDFNIMEQVHKGDVIEATVVQTMEERYARQTMVPEISYFPKRKRTIYSHGIN